MKKVLAIIVVFIYLVVSSGIVICLHYCMDRFDSAAIGVNTGDKCAKCGMHKDGGCCKDEIMVVKLQTSHIASPNITSHFSPLSAINVTNTGFSGYSLQTCIGHAYSIAHTPPINEQHIYLTNCVFRI